jgi:hypothetical protein
MPIGAIVPDLYAALLKDPASMIDACYYDGYRLSREQIETLQLEGARKRFRELRPRLSLLDKLASEQRIDALKTLDDLAPLIFAHTVYKSYPTSFIEKSRYDRMTRWLNGLTTLDLQAVDTTGIDSIDGWLDALDEQTQLRVFHTSGTSGKLSFVPRTREEWHQQILISNQIIRDHWGPGSGPDLARTPRPLIVPGYRRGCSNQQRGNDVMVTLLAGGEDNALFMYPNMRFSADVASLSGRLLVAQARGEQGSLQLSPALVRRRDEIAALERERPQALNRFFDLALQKFGGRDVYIGTLWPILYEWAQDGLKRGLRNVFGSGSIVLTGGGPKNKVLPENWREQVYEFLGTRRTYEFYGSSEIMAICAKCESRNYHLPPTLITFLLDKETGKPLPRTDGQTGRLAMFDLLPATYWAGIVTGDKVTLGGWQQPCGCGRLGPYLHPAIHRYSQLEGGDDKIMCSGAPEAHDRAMEFLSRLSE